MIARRALDGRHHDLERSETVRRRFPSLARAVASISSPPLRNMGTIGGNVCVDTRCTYYNQTEPWRRSIDYCMKEAGTVCWVAPSSPRCWAHSASDAAPMLTALGARVVLLGPEGERVAPLASLYKDDGFDYLAKRPDELVSIVLGAVGSRPVVAEDAAQALVGRDVDDDAGAEAARLARQAATPMDNTDFQAQWRGQMVERYTVAALREAAGLDPGVASPRHRLM
jgi:4-hydroxybenzoyl-CoA reductase subunit beta